jgi:hypothetical protein
MTQYLVKIAISVGLIVAVSEVSKRSTTLGALLASIPIVSVLAMIWMHVETGDDAKVADLASGIFWLVLPSLALFLVLPPLLRAEWNFWAALGTAVSVTVALYVVELWVLPRLGIKV